MLLLTAAYNSTRLLVLIHLADELHGPMRFAYTIAARRSIAVPHMIVDVCASESPFDVSFLQLRVYW